MDSNAWPTSFDGGDKLSLLPQARCGEMERPADNKRESVSTGRAFRHLVVFQFKLALDALRDLALSPLSIAVFVLDAFLKPPVEDSLYGKLMSLGRRSDRVINLFDEFGEAQHYTVDQTLNSVEDAVKPRLKEIQRHRPPERFSDDADGDSA